MYIVQVRNAAQR